MDYWRDLETGPKPPEIIYAVIENPKGTENKYEYDVKKKAMVLDRVLYSAVHYPGDYGFIPRTYDEDGDPQKKRRPSSGNVGNFIARKWLSSSHLTTRASYARMSASF